MLIFHHQSYGHTFPVPNEPTKPEVHQIPNHPAMICSIELPHSFFSQCSMVLPSIISLSRMLRYYRDLLLVLILSLILFAQFQQLQKLTESRFRQFTCVQHLPSTLQEVNHQPFLGHILRRITLISLNEVPHLFISRIPPLLLCHTSFSIIGSSTLTT